MDIAFWAGRWNEGRIQGFHEGKANELLARFANELGDGRTVLVPLCGKAEDLAYLASRGHHVVGIEVVEDAVKAFFAERKLTPKVSKAGALTKYESHGITLLAGDFFAVGREHAPAGGFDLLYDRAANIALPPPTRVEYVKHVRSLMKPGGKGLLITVEYDQSKMDGPPFSVPEAEVRAHYAGVKLELLDDVKAGGPRFEPLGGREKAWALGF